MKNKSVTILLEDVHIFGQITLFIISKKAPREEASLLIIQRLAKLP